MNTRALPAAEYLTALGVQPISTGHLLADCERWCRDRLALRRILPPPNALVLTATGARGH
jgi:hypothetical protein